MGIGGQGLDVEEGAGPNQLRQRRATRFLACRVRDEAKNSQVEKKVVDPVERLQLDRVRGIELDDRPATVLLCVPGGFELAFIRNDSNVKI